MLWLFWDWSWLPPFGQVIYQGLIMVVLGMLAATIGRDPMTGNLRFTFGSQHLWME